jgi:hypothetical protein
MILISDAIISIPLGILYYIFADKLGDVLFCSGNQNLCTQKLVIFLFFVGIIGIILTQTLFAKNNSYKSRVVKQGLIIGGIILICYSTLNNWEKLTDLTKLFIIGVAIAGIIWYCSKSDEHFTLNVKTSKKDKKKLKKLKKEYEIEDINIDPYDDNIYAPDIPIKRNELGYGYDNYTRDIAKGFDMDEKNLNDFDNHDYDKNGNDRRTYKGTYFGSSGITIQDDYNNNPNNYPPDDPNYYKNHQSDQDNRVAINDNEKWQQYSDTDFAAYNSY